MIVGDLVIKVSVVRLETCCCSMSLAFFSHCPLYVGPKSVIACGVMSSRRDMAA